LIQRWHELMALAGEKYAPVSHGFLMKIRPVATEPEWFYGVRKYG
jgi:hypothetical protein